MKIVKLNSKIYRIAANKKNLEYSINNGNTWINQPLEGSIGLIHKIFSYNFKWFLLFRECNNLVS